MLIFPIYCCNFQLNLDYSRVEVVSNHLEPYNIKGEPATLTLDKEFSIDFVSEEIGQLGIADAADFYTPSGTKDRDVVRSNSYSTRVWITGTT